MLGIMPRSPKFKTSTMAKAPAKHTKIYRNTV